MAVPYGEGRGVYRSFGCSDLSIPNAREDGQTARGSSSTMLVPLSHPPSLPGYGSTSRGCLRAASFFALDPGFQRFPALELFHEQLFDLGAAALILAQDFGRLAVVVGRNHLCGELLLLGLQRLDLARQGFELAGFFVGELCGRPRNPPFARGAHIPP